MTLELTQEEIVTNLLSANEIIKNKEISLIKNDSVSSNLGEYLENLPLQNDIDYEITEPEKYTFIKKHLWNY